MEESKAEVKELPAHKLVDLDERQALELDAIATHKQLALAQQKLAIKALETAQREAMLYQKKEVILMTRVAVANGIESFKRVEMAPQGKVLFVL
jgi:hypothetical protein